MPQGLHDHRYGKGGQSTTVRVPPSEAARVGRLFDNAGVRTEPGNLKIWKLPDPAPGFAAHVMLVGEDAWRMLMTATDPFDGLDGGTWWRSTNYPGLKHEFLQQDLWMPAVGCRAVSRPPFWPL